MATTRTPFTDSGITRRVISEMIGMIDWTQAPLLKRLGWENENRFNFVHWPPGGDKKIEWLEDSMSTLTDTTDGSVDATQTTVVVDNGDRFHDGHVLVVESEYMIVTAVSGNTLTVLRAQGGTTGATHADATTVTIRGIAKATGANYALGNTTTMSVPFNYTQIFEESVRVNRDQKIAQDYGVKDTMAYHLAKLIGGRAEIGAKGRAGQLTLLLADMAYYGKRQQPTNTARGLAGALDTFITTNTSGTTSTALVRSAIESDIRTIYNLGGEPDLIVCSPYAASKIASFYEGYVRTERSEDRGGSIIRYIDTPVREGVELMIDWKCPSTKLYILDSEKVGWVTIRPFSVEEKPSLGDYDVMSVLGEYSFVVCNESTHSIITHSSSL